MNEQLLSEAERASLKNSPLRRVVDSTGFVFCCDGKRYAIQSLQKQGLTWNPCENYVDRKKCSEWKEIIEQLRKHRHDLVGYATFILSKEEGTEID